MINSDRKKELKSQYLQMKPDMGVFVIRCDKTRKCCVQTAGDFRAVINGSKARLNGGFHPVQELQQEYNKLGMNNFTIEILEKLDYDLDEAKTDYKEELDLLKEIWEEKLLDKNWQLYEKRYPKPK